MIRETRAHGFVEYAFWIVLAGAAGANVFVTIQILAGLPLHIAEFMGAQIARRGGYDASLAGVIGWSVHAAVALGYATLFALILQLPGFPSARGPRLTLAALCAVGLGWLTTLIAPPAIGLTIGALAGQGIPDSLPGPNTSVGIPLWTHLAFFATCFLILAVARPMGDRRPSVIDPPGGQLDVLCSDARERRLHRRALDP